MEGSPHPEIKARGSNKIGKKKGLGQRPGSSQPQAQDQPTCAVHVAPIGAFLVDISAPCPAADLEDAVVRTSIRFMIHKFCIEAACVIS